MSLHSTAPMSLHNTNVIAKHQCHRPALMSSPSTNVTCTAPMLLHSTNVAAQHSTNVSAHHQCHCTPPMSPHSTNVIALHQCHPHSANVAVQHQCRCTAPMSLHSTNVTSQHECHRPTRMSPPSTNVTAQHQCHRPAPMSPPSTNVAAQHQCHFKARTSLHSTSVTSKHERHFTAPMSQHSTNVTAQHQCHCTARNPVNIPHCTVHIITVLTGKHRWRRIYYNQRVECCMNAGKMMGSKEHRNNRPCVIDRLGDQATTACRPIHRETGTCRLSAQLNSTRASPELVIIAYIRSEEMKKCKRQHLINPNDSTDLDPRFPPRGTYIPTTGHTLLTTLNTNTIQFYFCSMHK